MKHASGPRREQPFVYGFSMRVGKDGIPQIQPFGSAAPFTAEALSGDEVREPLTDVVESDKEVAVTVELPGVEKQDVNLHVAEDAVTVKVEKGRKYHKRISLPAKVVPPTAKATFKNGILDVTVARRSDADSGHKVSIQ